MFACYQELYVQHLSSNKGGISSPPVSGDISYPWFCSNQSLFPPHQTEVNAVMHITLVDWLVKVCIERGLPSCTLCLAIHLMDEFIRRQPDIPTHRFQLLGCACLILAAKLEQIKVGQGNFTLYFLRMYLIYRYFILLQFPGIDELVHISNYCFLRGDLIEMERTVLNVLDYNVSIPTRMYFLNRFILAAQVDDCPVTSSSGREESGDMSSGSNTSLAHLDLHQHQAANERNFKEACFAYYLLDLTLQNYAFNQYPMSVVAAAIVHYVKQYYRSVNELVWTPTLVFYTGYEERHLVPVLFAIHAIHSSAYCTGFTATVKKYYCQQYCYCCSEIAMSKERIRFDTLAAKNILNDFEERIAQEEVSEHDTVNGDDDSTEGCHENYDEQSDNTKCDVDADGDRVNLTPTSFLNDKAEVGEATDKEKNILEVNVNNSQHQRDTGIRKGPEHSGDIQQVVTHESTGGGGGGGLRLEFSGDDESVRKKQRCHSDHDSD